MMYLPDCKACDADGKLAGSVCPECNGNGCVNRWRECPPEQYAAAINAAGGLDALTVLSSYTCPDGDEWTRGRKIVTTWGTRDGEPVAHSEVTNGDPRADRSTDERRYWVWGAEPRKGTVGP